MSEHPSYFAWHPSFESGRSAVSILLTRGAFQQAPQGGREFFETVLQAAGIDVPLQAWGVEPFVTSYFSRRDWEECWEARLLLARKAESRTTQEVLCAPILAAPTPEDNPAQHLPVRVLANFKQKSGAKNCRDALRQHNEKAKWNEVHYERFALRDIGSRTTQLVVDVITAPRSGASEFFGAAEGVISICQQHGGRTEAPPVDGC